MASPFAHSQRAFLTEGPLTSPLRPGKLALLSPRPLAAPSGPTVAAYRISLSISPSSSSSE
jgi:hypothetical protein